MFYDINLVIRYVDYIVILLNDGSLYDLGEVKKVISEKILREVYGVSGDVIFDDDKKLVVFVKKFIRDN